MADDQAHLEAFAAAAEQFCAWAEGESRGIVSDARLARALISELFRRAIDLPEQSDWNGDAPEISIDRYTRVYQRFGSLPFNFYSECSNPLIVPAEEPITADLADDLADVWRDVKGGLLLFGDGNITAAAWHWRFHFEIHWGHHASAALYALQSWFSEHVSELDQLPDR